VIGLSLDVTSKVGKLTQRNVAIAWKQEVDRYEQKDQYGYHAISGAACHCVG
jgi:hypothetical protein